MVFPGVTVKQSDHIKFLASLSTLCMFGFRTAKGDGLEAKIRAAVPVEDERFSRAGQRPPRGYIFALPFKRECY
jgi:hypothetical protein